jgi:hypothetical protein
MERRALARLAGVFLAGDPGPMRWALVMELGVAPLLCLWQARVGERFDGRIDAARPPR